MGEPDGLVSLEEVKAVGDAFLLAVVILAEANDPMGLRFVKGGALTFQGRTKHFDKLKLALIQAEIWDEERDHAEPATEAGLVRWMWAVAKRATELAEDADRAKN